MDKKYYCRTCVGPRNHKLVFEKKLRGDGDHEFFMWFHKFSIIECLGCETLSFLEIYGDTEMWYSKDDGTSEYYFNENIYPPFIENFKELIDIHCLPQSIKEIYKETISAFKSNSFILSAGGLRAIIEAICNNLKIKKGNLAERIDQLNQKGFLTKNETKRLHSIRFLGNDALHEIDKPNKDQLYILFEIVNHLLENLFINDEKLKGKIDTIIDKYEDFFKLIQNKIDKDKIGKELSLVGILERSARLIPKEVLPEMEETLKAQIKSGNITFLKIISEGDTTIYVVNEQPFTMIPW